MSAPASPGTTLRTRAYAFGLLAVGGVAGLVTAGRSWWVGTAEGSTVRFTGTESSGGLAQAVPFVVAAGTLLALALRARGRRVVGVLLAVAGAGGALVGLLRPAPPRELVITRLQTITLGDRYALDATAWPSVFALVNAVVLVGAALMVRYAGRWPSRVARFERDAATTVAGTVGPPAESGSTAPTATTELAAMDERTLWSALDAGLDPTDPDPIRTSGPGGDTMRPAPESDAAPAPARRTGSEGE